MTSTRSILISGAGIAGPALAHWLHRHGYRATDPHGQLVDRPRGAPRRRRVVRRPRRPIPCV
ncbi:2-polyprenyl-6-methoxyphenol hydroxylase-like FAD-dependent oxidoreductase [Catenulispora sp. MAP12-49]|uniref:hypothetical protein n=1 Tax=unclassified Catenulispora TaxID=414885 RepID=UPI003513E06B